jgi:uroporphyrinogen decarboxylase
MPYLKEINQYFLDLGFKHLYEHICGEHNLNLPFWKNVPMGNPGIVSIGHEVKFAKAAETFPDDIILGNLEPAIIQTGTPDSVYEATKENVLDGKKISNGYIFSPGCEMPPFAPVENIKAMSQAVVDHGWY